MANVAQAYDLLRQGHCCQLYELWIQNLNGDESIRMDHEDETDRYCIQLYDHLARKTDFDNKAVLEVGSGRGGAASYIARYYKTETYTGLTYQAV